MRFQGRFKPSLPHRNSPMVVALTLVGWLAGCGLQEEAPHDPPPPLEVSDPAPATGGIPGVSGDSDPTLRQLVGAAAWSDPVGPRGGDFARVWATSRGYFALERGPHRPASLWRSTDGRDWSQVATSQDVTDLREIVAHHGKVYAFGDDLRVSNDGALFEDASLPGVSATDVLAARVFDDSLYLSLREGGFSSRIVRVDADATTPVAENLPTLAGDFIIDGNRVLITEGSYQGGIYVGELGSDQWSPAHTPSHSVHGGLDLHLTVEGYLATSSEGVWRSEDGTSFEVALHQEAAQATIAGGDLYFGTLEPWGYVAHVSLEALAGDRANARVSYLDPIHVDGFKLASDGTTIVGAAMGAGLFVHEPGSASLQNVSPLRRPILDLSVDADLRWALSGSGELFFAEGSAAPEAWQHRPFEDDRFERIAVVPGALFTITRDNRFLPLFATESGWRPGQSVALGTGRASALNVVGDRIWAGFAPVILHGERAAAPYGGGLFVARAFAARHTDWSQPDQGLHDLAMGRGTPPVYAILAESEPALLVGKGGIFLEEGGQWVLSPENANLDTEGLEAGQAWLANTSAAIYLATRTFAGSELRRSLDGGGTWTVLPLEDELGALSAMAAFDDALILANERGIFSLSSAGDLSPVGATSPEGTIHALVLEGSTLHAAGSQGIVALEVELR